MVSTGKGKDCLLAVEAEGLTIHYKRTVAVNNVSFTVKKGDIFGLLGPNGAGKTSTLRVLSCLNRSFEGTVKIVGYDVKKCAREVASRIAVVSQHNTLDPYMTAYDNLNFYGWLQGMPRRERHEKIIGLLEVFGMLHKKKALVTALSGGEYRRLQLARIFLSYAQVFFLDEPTLGFDVKGKSVLWDYLKQTCKKYGYSVVIATNDLVEAERMCDFVGLMKEGKFVATGSIQALQRLIGKTICVAEFEQSIPHDTTFNFVTSPEHILIRGNEVEIEWSDNNKKPSDILDQLQEHGTVKSFLVRKPDLNDVFVSMLTKN